ncbi:hypothetical protein [Alistipes sp.]|uniref:rolling circle replication-associated protein n=1 Tax=Alistipes sp. TaxID=1872444 RepID=UPI0025BE7027|nr:hypothetical protein [Alistipes sp.]
MTYNEVVNYAKLNYGTFWPPDYIVEVPCGYCFSCQKSQNNQYKIRLLYEVRKYMPGTCLFITLTFDDENLTRFKDNPNKAVRLFLDRMRKYFGRSVRHWIIGEFGTLRGRPHYHGILFDCPDELCDPRYLNVDQPGHHSMIGGFWQYGFVFVGYVSDATCGYITKYLTKSINGKNRRPRVITSKGIGDNYLLSEDARLHKQGLNYQPFMHINGFTQALPRYLFNKIFTDFDKSNMVLDRYLNPPPLMWQGVRYDNSFDLSMARRNTYLSNVALGLTPISRPPTAPVVSSFSRFKFNMEQNKEFTYGKLQNSQ